MKVLLPLLLLAGAAGPAPEARFEEANALYRAGDFAAASAVYDQLAAEGLTSPSLHLNLGNARMRLGRRGLSSRRARRCERHGRHRGGGRTAFHNYR